MRRRVGILVILLAAAPYVAPAATTQKHYYAHDAVEDKNGVIAPWYPGQNGQCDLRVRIAAETMKRYPWTDPAKAAAEVPHYVFSGAWKIAPDGTITIPPINDWANGDLGQRASYVLSALIDYYRYSGDPAAIAHFTLQANALLDHCLTPPDHPWPGFLISVPTQGKPYGKCDPHGFIQLDIVAEVGLPLIRAAQITGNIRWRDAARHWADLFAEKRNREPGLPPWNRYANPQDAHWEDIAAGGVSFILEFFDAVIRTGYTGKDNSIVEARKAGIEYLRDVLLPNWTGEDTWGRNYWDWNCHVQVENVTEFAARYIMDHPDEFSNWRSDARNVMSLFINRTGVSPQSNGDVYHGAWAYPESSGCCGRSLWYGPMELAPVYAQYGVLADSDWGRELARRQIILTTYDIHETGVVEDNIDGGQVVAGDWFKIAHPMALKHALAAMAWMPETLGPARENHIMRSTSTVTHVVYGKGKISYTTADAPPNTQDVLRLSFRPKAVRSSPKVTGSAAPPIAADEKQNRFQAKELKGGDFLITIRHDGAENVVIEGDDPQQEVDDEKLTFSGRWNKSTMKGFSGGGSHFATDAGAGVSFSFTGNQVRLIGSAAPDAGQADIYLDDVKQLVGLDCWNPALRHQQVLYYRNGLTNGPHTVKLVVRGSKNPLSMGKAVSLDGVQFSAETAENDFGAGGGPTGPQRFIFGRSARDDFTDSAKNAWRPATEFVIRAGHVVDSVALSWWTARRQIQIEGTPDPELYRYGVHGKEFWTDFTVGPANRNVPGKTGTYHVRLKFAETRRIKPEQRAVTIHINGQEMVRDFDIAATALAQARESLARESGRAGQRPAVPLGTGHGRAVDLVYNGIEPKNGVISIKFTNTRGGEAIIQAIEVAPGDAPPGATPVTLPATQPAAQSPK